jgi:hypothetical protein
MDYALLSNEKTTIKINEKSINDVSLFARQKEHIKAKVSHDTSLV